MKTEKMLLVLRVAALFTAAVDALFVIASAILLGLVLGSVVLMPAWYGSICLSVIIVNAALLCVGGIYLLFRKQ